MKSILSLREVLARGAACLSEEGRSAIVEFIRAHRCADGGFSGKSPASDVYYTAFAAAALDAIGERRALWKLPKYLRAFGDGEFLDFVHLACLAPLRASLPWKGDTAAVLDRLERYRSADGGYHHIRPGAEKGTGYALYLALEAYAAAGKEPPFPDRIRPALEGLLKSGLPEQTNTASAVMVACARLGVDPGEEWAAFILRQFFSEVGGFRACPGAPIPDLLSTASAIYSLGLFGRLERIPAAACRAFVECLWTDEGGFTGTVSDAIPDVEYTCYALLVLGCFYDNEYG